jgi:(1->4)-alpha-D-glucan 1-alpha-D-glucosylmutase
VLAVAGDAESWSAGAEAFEQAADLYGVDRPTAHLLWQTLGGVGPISEDRLHDYLEKAVREAKQHTAWIDGDPDYEERVRALASAALEPGHLKALVDTAVDHNRESVRAFVLGQKLLQLTLPGVPDTYQGCEIVNLTLVDPDNRRPVDFADLRLRLEDLVTHGPRGLDDEKLYVTVRTLALRKELRDFFGDAGHYVPMQATTRHVVGFTRGDEVAVLVTRAPRRLEAAGGWEHQTVILPEGLWRDELTDTLYEGGTVRCSDVFETMPVALLRRVHI